MKRPGVILEGLEESLATALRERLLAGLQSSVLVQVSAAPAETHRLLETWIDEERPLAVRVLSSSSDQDGTDQLLKQFTPEPRTIVLSPNPTLDAALLAKNHFGADRFLALDLGADAIGTAVVEQFARYLEAHPETLFQTVECLEDRASLEASFRLRQEVYRDDPDMHGWVNEDADFDVDVYDRRSLHFGLYSGSVGARRPLIGSSRIVTPDPQRAGEIAADLIPEDSAEQAVPAMEYWQPEEGLEALVEQWRQEGERVTEGSRLAISVSERSSSGAKFLAETTISNWVELACRLCVMSVRESHVRAWSRWGFRQLESVPVKQVKSAPAFACIVLDGKNLPRRVESLAATDAARRASGWPVCLCAERRRCAGEPYETGDMSAIDVLCPALAARQLRDQAK